MIHFVKSRTNTTQPMTNSNKLKVHFQAKITLYSHTISKPVFLSAVVEYRSITSRGSFSVVAKLV